MSRSPHPVRDPADKVWVRTSVPLPPPSAVPLVRRALALIAFFAAVVALLIAERADARQFVPEVVPPAEAVTRALEAAWLTDEERKDLRVAHGLWSQADLDTPRRAARVALDAWDLDAPALRDPAVPAAWRAEVHLRRGHFAEALTTVEGDSSPQATAVRAEALFWLGRRDEAIAAASSLDRLLEPIGDAKDAETIDPDDIVAAARAAVLRGRLEARSVDDWQRVLDALGGARQALDRLHWPSLLTEGELLADKHHEELAIPALMQALSLGPKSSETWYRLGLLAVDRFVFEDAERAIRALKRIRAGHPLALELEASLALQRRDPDLAEQALTKLLQREPSMPMALALRAATDAARHDLDGTRRWLATLETIAPGNAFGSLIVGRQLADVRQYDESAGFLQDAIRRAPNWSDAHIALGLLETQTARDDRSRAALTEAMRLDPFNKRAQNSLTLLGELQSYVRFEGKHFIVRCKPGVDEIIAAMMPAALDAMHETVTARFRFEPPERTVIDLMPDHASFAVRITGMPQIHTIAACTGPMIAIEVPKQGPRTRHMGLFDWLKVLRHEYTHTVTLAQTRNRIPHWLTEAAAVSMEFAPRDYATCQMLARELEQGTLFDLDSINWGFVRPLRPQDRSLAYAQGHWMVEYMNERFGEEALVKLLGIYRGGAPEARAVPEALGVSREAFYRSFLAWAREQVKSWGLAPFPSLEDIVIAERSRDPQQKAEFDAAVSAALEETAARISSRIGEPGDPKTDRVGGADWARPKLAPLEIDDAVMGRWLAEYPNHPDILERALRRSIDRLGGAPPDPMTLDLLHRYMLVRPVDPFPHRLLAKIELASEDPTRAIPHLVELDRREEHDNAYALELARLYRSKREFAAASDSVERAVRMDPYDPAVRELAAAIAIESKRLPLAREHVAALERIEPDQPRHRARLVKLDELMGKAPVTQPSPR